ncbi:MAG: tetratricopeptide repeat protein [Thermoplasmata archaeon]
MPCLRCGGESEEGALLCDGCADACFLESRFFLNPILIGPSLFSRLRSKGSAACHLGPTAGSDVVRIASVDLQKIVKDVNVQVMPHDDLPGFYQRCNAILAHLGVPLRLDSPQMLLTEDAADTITTIVQKVNATEKIYPLEGMSDLYIRVGVVYWSAAHSILFRTASKKWRADRKSYLVARAKEYFSKVNPGDDLYSIAARNMGMLCLDAEEWTEAEEHLSNALRSFPNDLDIAQGLARAHLMLGNQLEALSRVDDIMNQGERPELWILKGKILRDLDRSNEALECFNRALSLDPRYLPAHDIAIETLRDLGRMEEAALVENQRSLARRPDLEQKIAQLISEFKRATVEERPAPVPVPPPAVREEGRPPGAPAPAPAPSKTLSDLARESLQRGDYDNAIQQATEALRERPDLRDANLVLIEALMAKGNTSEAASRVYSFYEKNRDDPVAWYWRGAVAAKEGKWGASVQYLSKAVSLDPKLVDAWTLMGDVLLDHDKSSGADESYSRALQLDDDNARAWLGKAKTMKLMGRWGAAIQCLDKYNALVPLDKGPWLLKADILFEKEKYQRAIETYDAYLRLAQDDSYALARKGIALNAIGDVEEAKRCLEESVRLDPNNKEAVKWLRTVSGGGGH